MTTTRQTVSVMCSACGHDMESVVTIDEANQHKTSILRCNNCDVPDYVERFVREPVVAHVCGPNLSTSGPVLVGYMWALVR